MSNYLDVFDKVLSKDQVYRKLFEKPSPPDPNAISTIDLSNDGVNVPDNPSMKLPVEAQVVNLRARVETLDLQHQLIAQKFEELKSLMIQMNAKKGVSF